MSDGLVVCPSCGEEAEDSRFDFHHWDYDNDIGCRLCRDCHQHIHRGMRAFEQTKEVGTEWQRDAVPRLYACANSNGLEFDSAVEFCHRFNIPKGSTAQKAVSELFIELNETIPITEMMADE